MPGSENDLLPVGCVVVEGAGLVAGALAAGAATAYDATLGRPDWNCPSARTALRVYVPAARGAAIDATNAPLPLVVAVATAPLLDEIVMPVLAGK